MAKQVLYYSGRTFQIIGLMALPYSMWITQFDRSERAALAVFLASIFIFFVGYLLTRFSTKL